MDWLPREGNGWSCKYARRQWDLVDNKNLLYHAMADFDADMLKLLKVWRVSKPPLCRNWHNDEDQVLVFQRKDLIFCVQLQPQEVFTDYGFW